MSRPDRPADSAGVPWSGRTLAAQPFPGDDGGADPALVAALATVDLEAVVAAWAPTRVMVPIVAVSADGTPTEGDKSADMALVTVTGPDGVRSLPVFSAVDALTRWDAAARPVPVEAARAAQAAVAEDCPQVVIDAAGPHPRLLPRPAVWAVAQGRTWVPPARDVEVLTGVANLARAVPAVRAHRCQPDPRRLAGLVVVLGLPPGLAADDVRAATERMSQLLGADPVVGERVEAIRLAVRAV